MSTASDSDESIYDPEKPLSARRLRVINELLPAVMGSKHPEPRFNLITNGIALDLEAIWKTLPSYTTCEALPGYIGNKLGMPGLAGLENIRKAGRDVPKKLPPGAVRNPNKYVDPAAGRKGQGAWRYFMPEVYQRPRPGDMYALFAAGVMGPWDGLITHVGIIVEISGDIWKTADAGQGQKPEQKADYVHRRFDAESGLLTGEVIKYVERTPARRLAGWLDIDAYFGE